MTDFIIEMIKGDEVLQITLETVKVNKVSQMKRVLCYWSAFQKIKAEETSKVLADYEKTLSKSKNWLECYRDFFNNQEINDEQEVLRLYDFVAEEEDKSIRGQLKKAWENVKTVINKEINEASSVCVRNI